MHCFILFHILFCKYQVKGESDLQALEIKRSYVSGVRSEFKLEEDQYEDWVMLAAFSGRFAFAMDDREEAGFEEAAYGELVLCPPGMRLKRRVVEPLSFLFIEFASEQEWPSGKLAIRDLQRLESTYRYLRIACAQSEEGEGTVYIRHFVGDLLAVLSLEQASSADRARKTKQDPVMGRVLAYLERHALEYGWNLGQLSNELGIGASQLTRRFRQAYGQSPVEYLTSIRLQKARSLLVETDDTLEHIAEQCGYQNAFYFSRMFKSKCKINPSDYRKKHSF
ncbi:hypothetical protein B1748_02405 [Paenibacillus sp. MY03]|nr:hypothetical protein B1748_02405 [Paenibacillus sp. MY03]